MEGWEPRLGKHTSWVHILTATCESQALWAGNISQLLCRIRLNPEDKGFSSIISGQPLMLGLREVMGGRPSPGAGTQ